MNALHYTEYVDNMAYVNLAIPMGIAFDRFGRKQCLHRGWFEGIWLQKLFWQRKDSSECIAYTEYIGNSVIVNF